MKKKSLEHVNVQFQNKFNKNFIILIMNCFLKIRLLNYCIYLFNQNRKFKKKVVLNGQILRNFVSK